MNKLQTINPKILAKINEELKEKDLDWLQVGVILVRDEQFYRVERIFLSSIDYWDKDKKETRKKAVTKVNLSRYRYLSKEWIKDDEKELTLDNLKYYGYDCPIITDNFEEYLKNVINDISIKETPEESPISESTEVGFRLGKDHLIELQNKAKYKLMQVEAKSRALKAILATKRRELEAIADSFKKQLKTINRVIYSIELYLGVKEDIVHLLQGENAPSDEPIAIRQMLLYMDEEVAEWRKGGLDFKSIDMFDTWIKKDRNFEKLLPEKKGVVGIRIRRKDKEYEGYDPIQKALYNEANMSCYFLIRNGENVYAIWTKMGENFPSRLFPKKDEFQNLLEQWKKVNWESDKEVIEDKLFNYKRVFLVLKGIVERTQIFHPLPVEDLDIFRPESYGNFINYIYDDETALPDGRLRYNEWKRELNKGLKRGSRIYIGRQAPSTGGKARTFNERAYDSVDPDRCFLYSWETYSAPSPGIYTLEEGEEEIRIEIYEYYKTNKAGKKVYLNDVDEERWGNEHSWLSSQEYDKKIYKGVTRRGTGKFKSVKQKYWYIRYNPGGEARSGWDDWEGHPRKNKISYRIYSYDSFIFNYDALPLEDIDFYLESRIDRPNYLEMLPTLQDLKALRLKEMEWEKHFAELTKNEIKKSLKLDDRYDLDILLEIWDAIDWWKKKVIWKRPISKDDAKALRMIKSRVINKLKGN
ncbi:MAG: hypothetical protein M0R03_11030 [Novosphingobium sp.]|nr:hypothetical protein [Novosphingobium sp.]